MDLKTLFEQATADSKNLTDRPSNDTLLQLYSLYKQATEGDVNVDPPANPFDFVSKAKFEAWAGLKGKTKEAAMQDYVSLIDKLKG
jgi:acyl-CoA-binding protein